MSDNRTLLLEKSFGLFFARGYKDVSIQQIVDTVGMTKGAFYYFFDSKEALFREVFEHFVLGVMRIDYASLSHESLRLFYRDYLGAFNRSSSGQQAELAAVESGKPQAAKGSGIYIFLLEVIKYFPDWGRRAQILIDQEMEAWTEMIGLSRSRGEIKSSMSDRQIAELFIFTSDGLGIWSCLLGRFPELMTQISALWDGLYKELTV